MDDPISHKLKSSYFDKFKWVIEPHVWEKGKKQVKNGAKQKLLSNI